MSRSLMDNGLPASEDLFEEALDLIIRLQNGPDNPVALDLVRQWRARSPAHDAAWAEVAEIHGMAGRVLAGGRRRPGGGGPSRRAVLGTLGVASLAAVGALQGPRALMRLRSDHATDTAEIRQVPLSDGTVVTLGPESAIRLAFTPAIRRVELLAGMAYFDVASERERPFQGIVADRAVTAVGAAFDMTTEAGFLSVSVARGSVQVEGTGRAGLEPQIAAAGEWLRLDEEGQHVERGRRETGQLAAWRQGLAVVDGETIAAVTASIGRWYSGRIFIADPTLGSLRISGVFDLARPIDAIEALAHPHGARVRRLSPWLTIISRV